MAQLTITFLGHASFRFEYSVGSVLPQLLHERRTGFVEVMSQYG